VFINTTANNLVVHLENNTGVELELGNDSEGNYIIARGVTIESADHVDTSGKNIVLAEPSGSAQLAFSNVPIWDVIFGSTSLAGRLYWDHVAANTFAWDDKSGSGDTTYIFNSTGGGDVTLQTQIVNATEAVQIGPTPMRFVSYSAYQNGIANGTAPDLFYIRHINAVPGKISDFSGTLYVSAHSDSNNTESSSQVYALSVAGNNIALNSLSGQNNNATIAANITAVSTRLINVGASLTSNDWATDSTVAVTIGVTVTGAGGEILFNE
jgi:hypothetical protein